jgi:hypothetical protein
MGDEGQEMSDGRWKIEDGGLRRSDEGRSEIRMNAVCYLYL